MLWMGIWVHSLCCIILHVQVGVNFRKNGVWTSLCDVVVSWLRLQTPIDCILHPIGCIQHVLAPWDAVDGHMGASIDGLHVQVGVNFRKTVPNTWGNTQYMTAVKLMPGGHWRWRYTRVTHAPSRWSWISWRTSSSCINRRGTTITSRYASHAQHLIPFQNSRGIITDTVVGIRGRLLGREPSLRSLIATLFRIPRLWCMKTPVWLNLSR